MGRQGNKRQVGAARRRSRGHGLARLDGTRPRATVASKVMRSGEMAGQATATLCADCMQAPARRPEAEKPGRRRQGCGRLAKASPVRDERIANLEQRGLQSGDETMYFAYYLFVLVGGFRLRFGLLQPCRETLMQLKNPCFPFRGMLNHTRLSSRFLMLGS